MDTATASGTAWIVVLPVLLVAGFLLAFLAGGILAVRLQDFPRKGRLSSRTKSVGVGSRILPPESAQVPASDTAPVPAGHDALSLDKGLVFGHEMRNYLCAIRGNARLLRLGAQGKELAAIIDRIDRALEKLENFEWKEPSAPDILTARTQECLNLAHVARACSGLHFAQPEAVFRCDNPEGLPPVLGDPHRLDQVFNNLYRNALEAGATRIATRFRRIGNEVEITIEDNGRGCPAKTAKRIFEPFFSTKAGSGPGRPARGRLEPRPGNRGLGLFIVQSIVENHGGRIRANSKNGRGDGESGLVVYLNFPVFSPNKVLTQGPSTPVAAEVKHPIAFGA